MQANKMSRNQELHCHQQARSIEKIWPIRCQFMGKERGVGHTKKPLLEGESKLKKLMLRKICACGGSQKSHKIFIGKSFIWSDVRVKLGGVVKTIGSIFVLFLNKKLYEL
jgi:ribosomal protein L44E